MSELELVMSHVLARDEDGADRVEEWEHGAALVSPSLPVLWDANYLRVERPAGLDAPALAAEAERVLGGGGARHRAIVVPDATVGESLRPGFSALAWDCDRLMFMVLRGTPHQRPGAPAVEEVDLPDLAALKHELALTDPHGGTEVAREVLVREERLGRRDRRRHFAARANGRLAASCSLVARDGVHEVDDVSTLPEFRGLGLARAAVVCAVTAARAEGAEIVFLGAYRDDWPHRWYLRLGFEPVGMLVRFRRIGGTRR
jgi:GNAT superfamily N-acetyltransferase